MHITVVLCTYNRGQTLAKTLESVRASTLPESVEWEVLVADNNSTDGTRQVIEDFCHRYPGRFRYLFVPKAGKSYGLNAGIREARGEVLAFTDDDVTVEPTWLRNLTAILSGEEYVGAGGRILPSHPFSPPPWLPVDGPYNMSGVLALFDLGDKAGNLDRAPYGANMAFQRKVFERYGTFRTDLGPSPNDEIPRPNEDTEFGRRLMAAGERLRYQPSAVVYHPVPNSRLKKEYFLAWWFDYGRAVIREKERKPDPWGIPRHLLSIPRMIGTYLSIRALQWICTLNPQRRFYRKSVVWMIAGEIVETCHQARRANIQKQIPNQKPGKQFKVETR